MEWEPDRRALTIANDFIIVNTSKSLGAKVVSVANALNGLRAQIDQIAANVNHLNDGVSYSTLESQFGLQTGTGANFATLVNILQGILTGSTGAGGTTQQGQILEFCARLSGQ